MNHSILVVDDEVRLADVLAAALEDLGYRATAVHSARAALTELEQTRFDLVLTDLRLPVMDGRALLREVRSRWPEVPVIVITAFAAVRDAVELVKEGAFDYIAKPFEIEDVSATIRRALRVADIVRDNERLRGELEGRYSFDTLVGNSAAFRRVIEQVTEVCETKATVLLNGESGTGKELVAKAIHFNSPRRDKPFIAVNCAAIPETLLESELFGHVKGAFTGALANRTGRFAAADGGTLFLDEIGDMPLPIQAKLLRVIQERSFEPVGATRTQTVDVRLVAATHKDMRQAVDKGSFREDLFYRLNVFPIQLPPLRDRPDDIPLLAGHFLADLAESMGKRASGFSPAAMTAMAAYDWPGNIRELHNCIERAVIVAKTQTIDVADLPQDLFVSRRSDRDAFPRDLDAELERIERDFIIEALRRNDGVQVRAAKLLGIAERSLWHRIKKLGIRLGRSIAD
ncbi:DNA-binding transcriptional response regulator, NtrC family, contains REC, AAA-type ATPase, and a Fis-type DNA-binding domains [Bosea sp. CRIB-10]|uniref:sigma-54-dependent transcriptional regulator n=1 Tax=Bosea sp. CRIB-10 TaxID=378404 RepID=UPI0008F2AA8E|nr:sigma-54 dependent transcriptional regulator [Bosea sp. CRIB-10]SFC47032.1 DNA-binding transcriptional response regulator, NtrC family, contains REC, AAA-type ATPase, and a Fis-type DNA-binding domains [Bosea sp. CRIB-10]